jgi:hypothetical protein
MAIFAASDDPPRLTHLATIVMSAVLLDRPVLVVWMGAALGQWMRGGLDETAPGALLREARMLGTVSFLACSADARPLGLDRAAFLARVDDVLAMTTILHRIEGAGTVLYL